MASNGRRLIECSPALLPYLGRVRVHYKDHSVSFFHLGLNGPSIRPGYSIPRVNSAFCLIDVTKTTPNCVHHIAKHEQTVWSLCAAKCYLLLQSLLLLAFLDANMAKLDFHEEPMDEAFALAAAYQADISPSKVSLGAGVYRDAAGKIWVLPSVAEVHFNKLALSI